MRVLFTVPHFYRGVAVDSRHGSESTLAREARKRAIEGTIFQIHNLFGSKHFAAQHLTKTVAPVPNPLALEFDIVVCTTGDDHLLDEIELPSGMYAHFATEADPKFLGWECHKVLREAIGHYDYYCYLEDDILIEDPFFFAKLNLVNQHFEQTGDPFRLLQPQRFETSLGGGPDRHAYVHRIYMDYRGGDQPLYRGDPFQIEYLGVTFTLEPTSHPHAGCFFLTDQQMRHLGGQPIFLDRETIWVTPLDTAATLAIGRTFRVYKPALDSMDFLSVRHAHHAMLQTLFPGESGIPAWRF